MLLTAVRYNVNNLESSVVVQELELSIFFLYRFFVELNSIKNPIKQDLLQILVLVQQQNFLNC